DRTDRRKRRLHFGVSHHRGHPDPTFECLGKTLKLHFARSGSPHLVRFVRGKKGRSLPASVGNPDFVLRPIDPRAAVLTPAKPKRSNAEASQVSPRVSGSL